MIDALHLLWIIPLSAFVGFSVAAIAQASKSDITFDKEEERNCEK